jgi:hypothetical protein
VVKLSRLFSIVVVFTLLILVAPALAPPMASANDIAGLPNPLTVNFSATVSEGDPFSFNVVPNATIGTVLNQFARPWMIINQTANNNTAARLFNMSTASGTLSGNLNGTANFRWNRIDFNLSYENSTQWYINPPTGMGILYIRGSLNDTELGDLDFVSAADFDYNSTLVKGEGRVMTVEDWTEGLTTAPSRVLIGDISYEYVVSTGAMTGTFSLRHYMENPVGLAGKVNTTQEWLYLEGQLIDDESDWITNDTVEFMQFTGDPVLAGTEVQHRIVLEEMAPGREINQTITAGHMGVNGTISLLRTGVLDVVWVELADADIPFYSVTGTRTVENNWPSNKSATHGGIAKTIVLVDMVGFCLADCPTPPGPGIDQHSFTIMPSYSEGYEGTGFYAGFESYVVPDTHINLDYTLFGDDYRYALMPTPVVSSVNPIEEGQGNSTNVTINGKWFWVNTTFHPLTIDFGPGITTNSYTVVSDSQLIANITVAGDAFVGPRDVKVTKRGVTGTLAGGFAVSGPTGSLNGTFTFAAGSMDGRGLVVSFYDPGTKGLLFTGNAVTDAQGNFTLEAGIGTYDIGAKNCTCLSEMVYGKQLTDGGTTFATFTTSTSREGDINEDDWVTAKDRGLLYNGWGTQNVIQSGHYGDLNRDGWLTAKDRGLMYNNWGQSGDLQTY